MHILQSYGKKHGIRYNIVDSLTSPSGRKANAQFKGNSNVITIALDSDQPMLVVAGHETFHYLRDAAPESAKVLQDFVIDKLKASKDFDYDQRFNQLAELYGTSDTDVVDEEIAANAMFDILTNEKAVRELAKNDETLFKKIKDIIEKIITDLKAELNRYFADKAEARALKDDIEALEQIRALFNTVLWEIENDGTEKKYAHALIKPVTTTVNSNNSTNTANESTVEADDLFDIDDDDAKYSIQEDVQGKYVKIDTHQNLFTGKSIYEMQKIAKDYILNYFRGKVLDVGENGKAYVTKRSAEEFSHPASRRLDVSIKSAKMKAAPELDNLLSASVFVEHQEDNNNRHPDAVGGWDVYLTRFEIDDTMFTGEVKIKNTVRGYVFYDITKIKKLPAKVGLTVKDDTAAATGSSSTTTIPQKVQSVNSSISENGENDTIKFSLQEIDRQYAEAVKNGDEDTARKLIVQYATKAGYDVDTSWRMDHTAPNSTDGYSHSMPEIDKAYGGDGSIYSQQAAYYYGEGRSYDTKTIAVIRTAKYNPDKLISIYRAVPTNIKDTRVRNGDWVAITREYAQEHGWRVLDDDFRIIENKVPAKHLYSNGDSINEWGYDNGNGNEVYKNTENNVKLLEVTYDDKGELIPLSKRFDENKGDVRYSLSENAEKDVETVLNDFAYRAEVRLTDCTPSIVASQKGAKSLPMFMKASHIRENIFTEQEAKSKGLKVNKYINYHGLGKDLFLQIIDGLEEVTEAYRGTKNAADTSRRENYFLLISQYTDKDGNTVNVPIFINEKGQHNNVFIDINKIATVFGRDNFSSYIQKEIKTGNLVRIKNKSIQASERTTPIVGGYSENTSNKTIPQNAQSVNSSISENGENDTIKFSIQESTDGKYVQVDTNIFDETDGKSYAQVIAEYISGEFENLIEVNGQSIRINSITNREWRMSGNARNLSKENSDIYFDKLKAIANADELLQVAKDWINEDLKHNRTDNFISFGRGIVDFKVKENGYSADIIVGLKADGSATLYDMVDIRAKKITAMPSSSPGKPQTSRYFIADGDNISQSTEDVKSKFSLQEIENIKEEKNR